MLHMLNQPNGYAADYARKQVGAQTPKISVKVPEALRKCSADAVPEALHQCSADADSC
ncbi:hypothetical protein [Gardnerella greenwoodii]|uniref:hypothetical protein n=1 Tax=Gardnerella greenwoodii TaxID=2914925 RepID=UPI0015E0EBD6|nr:hypothetical protein [Gardnerella greenwoodii]MDF0753506.1 hypothetical protein [Gardnerella greenwoodii]